MVCCTLGHISQQKRYATSRPIKRQLSVYGTSKSRRVNKMQKLIESKNKSKNVNKNPKENKNKNFLFSFLFSCCLHFCFYFHFCFHFRFCFNFHFCFNFVFVFIFVFIFVCIFVFAFFSFSSCCFAIFDNLCAERFFVNF